MAFSFSVSFGDHVGATQQERSSLDSRLEEHGFELSVPLTWCDVSRALRPTCFGRTFPRKSSLSAEAKRAVRRATSTPPTGHLGDALKHHNLCAEENGNPNGNRNAMRICAPQRMPRAVEERHSDQGQSGFTATPAASRGAAPRHPASRSAAGQRRPENMILPKKLTNK